MNIVYQFFRNNHILAICEDAIVSSKFTLNLSRFEMTEVPNKVEECEIILKLFLNHNHLTKVCIILWSTAVYVHLPLVLQLNLKEKSTRKRYCKLSGPSNSSSPENIYNQGDCLYHQCL